MMRRGSADGHALSREGWNHNSHYHDWLMRKLPRRFERGLDVGCGQGFFAARLAAVADRIDALVVDADVLAEASELHSAAGIAFQRGNFL
jgi:2-polyprenyl-3-methyl-5-hydroxy-6-metoxy-1,4-benzoquinol methylase